MRRAATSRTTRGEQLWQAIEAVFRSWNNQRAIVYRRMHDIPEDWGTACNVQAMVFGNLGETSATGVAFTRDPSTGERKLYGEWLPNAQGRRRRRRHPHAASACAPPRPRGRITRSPDARHLTANSTGSRRRSSITSATYKTSSSRCRAASSTCSSAARPSGRHVPECESPWRWPKRASSRATRR